jgi:hypothetical protein
MTGFLGDADISANRIEALRASLSSYIDLTSANPTTQGQRFPADILARAAAPYWESRIYAPLMTNSVTVIFHLLSVFLYAPCGQSLSHPQTVFVC